MLTAVLCCACLAAEEAGPADTAAVEVAPREGLYIDEGERLGMRDRISRMLEMLAQGRVDPAAELCNSIRQEATSEFLRVPVAVLAAEGPDAFKMLPPGLIRAQAEEAGAGDGPPNASGAQYPEDPSLRTLSLKARREVREIHVVRYVGVRWFCDLLLAGHAGLRDALGRLVGVRAGEAKKKALASGGDEDLLQYAAQYGCSGPGDEVVLLFARRCMERGQICRALALFEICRGGAETDRFINACRALRAKNARLSLDEAGAPAEARPFGNMPGTPADLQDAASVGVSRLSPLLAVGSDLVGVEVAVEPATQKFVHYLTCRPAPRRRGGAGECANNGWRVPVCWQTAPRTALDGDGKGNPREEAAALETLGRLLTMPAATDDGLVVAETGHGAVVAVDLLFGRPVWLLCYAVDSIAGGERKGQARSPFIPQFAPPYGWAPQPPRISNSSPIAGFGLNGTSFETARARERRTTARADSFVVATPCDSSGAYVIRASDGSCTGAIESSSVRRRGAQGDNGGMGGGEAMRARRFEYRWATTDDSGFVFLVGASVVALDFAGTKPGRGRQESKRDDRAGKDEENPAHDKTATRGSSSGNALCERPGLLAVDTFPLPEAALSGGVAVRGMLVVPTSRGLYEIDFARVRPAMRCLAEWQLPEDADLEFRVDSEGTLEASSPSGAVLYRRKGWGGTWAQRQ